MLDWALFRRRVLENSLTAWSGVKFVRHGRHSSATVSKATYIFLAILVPSDVYGTI
jgi:hypothetical protein